MSQMAPQIYDMPKLHRGMLEVLGIKNADKLVPLPDDQKPCDPVTENMKVLKSEPLKAFQYQDHDAHIRVHMAAMQDPIIQQLIGQNPAAQQIAAALNAHIAEHVGYAYRQKIEQQLGMPLPPQDDKLPPEIEMQLSSMMAQAAQQVLQQNQQVAANQQAQQQAQDPVVQMQQQELQLRAQELQIKAQESQARIALDQQRVALEAEKVKTAKIEKAMRDRMDTRKLQVNALQAAGKINAERVKNQQISTKKEGKPA